MPVEFLTKKEWNKFLNNEWRHTVRRLFRMEGMMYVLVPLMIAVLVLIIELVKNGHT